MTVNTSELRVLADDVDATPSWPHPGRAIVPTDTVRALCDAADEVERLRAEVKAITASYKQQKHSAMVARDMDEKRARQRDNAVQRGDRIKAQRDAARAALDAVLGLCNTADAMGVNIATRHIRTAIDDALGGGA